ncbi:beta-propeller domain-containing protein [Microbispora sp. RL4-1S]|uniref:Beta-propeller domain-containing protein n=1 Tax=Microbispora oryzae TaxID=2806554 RepID=A0A940WKY4_9ACTN|nr:beta-propeller domain-containing protein [Microbispora oryzae]MBP2704808.1 beta-propeller domain-containing protein [Microbispora oryzae]
MKTWMRTAGVLAAAGLLVTACADGRATPSPGTADLTGKVRLVSYSGCDEMTAGLRETTARNVTAWGFGPGLMFARSDAAASAKQATPAPSYSTTNVQEAGVDEPDVIKTDGKRVISVSAGVLRVVDTASRAVTGTLRLVPPDQSWMQGDLLVSGDRALVLFQGGGAIPFGAMAKRRPGPDGSMYLLVDLSGRPRVLGTLTAHGTHVDARQVGSTVRIVVRSQPEITFPPPKENAAESEMLDRNREAVRSAPAEAWQPSYEIESGGARRTERVGCDQVSHPDEFTGTSMLTVHTVDLAADPAQPFAADTPVAVAADGDTVYGTRSSLYVTSNPRWWFAGPAVDVAAGAAGAAAPATSAPAAPPERTEVHRFDIGGAGAPRYVSSGAVPGRLLNQYSLSEYEGRLRVATTSDAEVFGATPGTSQSGVYVLDANTLGQVGSVTGLGRGERIYSVRFIGDLGYVVTFRQTDPLYALDLRDPARPRVSGELKITGYSAYLHPAGDGRLIGIGQEASTEGRATGTQISLFDVSDPAAPTILSRFHQPDSGSEAEWDPHAFLYWPESGLAMVPLTNWSRGAGAAVVLRVGDDAIAEKGVITHPVPPKDGVSAPDPSIHRCLVIGDTLWTLSDLGLKVSDSSTLADRAWIPFA